MALLFQDNFDYADGVVTNEYATHHPNTPGAHVSPVWMATSGTLFARGGQGYTGVPDANTVDIDSVKGNNSAVLRVITQRTDFRDVVVEFDLKLVRFVTTPQTPATPHDGVHVFLRRQGAFEHNYRTYYVSLFRRDGLAMIKKKLSPTNDTYLELARTNNPVSAGAVLKRVQVSVRTEADGSVRLKYYVNGMPLLETVDPAANGPFLDPGSVGLRGDNCEFFFDNFRVYSVYRLPPVTQYAIPWRNLVAYAPW
jgi:hypothetical protein